MVVEVLWQKLNVSVDINEYMSNVFQKWQDHHINLSFPDSYRWSKVQNHM